MPMKCNRITPPHTDIVKKRDEEKGGHFGRTHTHNAKPRNTHTINVSIQLHQINTLGFTHHSRIHLLRTLRRKGLPGTEPRMGLEHLALNIRIATVLKGSRIRPRLSISHGMNISQESRIVGLNHPCHTKPSNSTAEHVD